MLEPKGRRTSIEIVADVLRLLRLGHAGKTEIALIAKTSREQTTKYLKRLLDAGMIEDNSEEAGFHGYRITGKGLALLLKIENVRGILPPDDQLNVLHSSRIMGMNIGRIRVTRGVADLIKQNPRFAAFVKKSLNRYRKGDWGELSDRDRVLNEQSLERNLRLFSSYESLRLPEIWIVTEPDRSYTTIMFPEENVSLFPLEGYPGAQDNSPKSSEAS